MKKILLVVFIFIIIAVTSNIITPENISGVEQQTQEPPDRTTELYISFSIVILIIAIVSVALFVWGWRMKRGR